MALIEKRIRASGRASYRVRMKYRGRVLSSTHDDRTKVERWAAETGARIRDDAHFAGDGNRRRALADLIDRYVEHVLPGSAMRVRNGDIFFGGAQTLAICRWRR